MNKLTIDHTLSGILRGLARIEIALLAMAMVFIILAIATQTVTRYVFGQPITWVEEASVYAFIWITFMGASYGAKQGKLIKVELLAGAMSENAARNLLALSQLLSLIACVYLALIVPKVIGIEGNSKTISLPVDLPRSWFYSVPLFYFTLVTALTSLARLYRLAVLRDTTPILAPFPVEEDDFPLPQQAS